MVSGSSVGLLAPCHLIGLVVLLVSPRVVSLRVWADVGLAITYWVDSLLNKRSRELQRLLSWIQIVSTNRRNVCLPLSLVGLISLVISPGIVSLVILRNFWLSIMVWNVLWFLLCKNFWQFQWILSRVEIVRSNSSNMSFPFGFVRFINLVGSPCIISSYVTWNSRLSIMVRNELLLSLG